MHDSPGHETINTGLPMSTQARERIYMDLGPHQLLTGLGYDALVVYLLCTGCIFWINMPFYVILYQTGHLIIFIIAWICQDPLDTTC